MGRRGPLPKDPAERARRNVETVPGRRIPFVKAKQPALPTRMPDGSAWPARTRSWWKAWAAAAQSDRFTQLEWDYLLDTAVFHGQLWSGDAKAAKAAGSELRLRLSKFGATPDDLSRMGIRYDHPSERAPVAEEVARSLPQGQSSRERYSGLKVVHGGGKEA